MHANTHTPAPRSPWTALLHSKWACAALVAGACATASSTSHANDANLVLGAGVGAIAGAVIGQSVAGRNGAIIGAGAGGLVGASIAQRGGYGYPAAAVAVQPVNAYPAYPAYPGYRYQAPAPTYYAPPPAVVYQPPVYRVETWRAPQHRHDHGNHYGWNRDQRDHRAYGAYGPAPHQEQRPFIDGRGDQERLRHERWD